MNKKNPIVSLSYFFSFHILLDYDLASNVTLIINVVICLFYPLNFAIYCGMSRYDMVKVLLAS